MLKWTMSPERSSGLSLVRVYPEFAEFSRRAAPNPGPSSCTRELRVRGPGRGKVGGLGVAQGWGERREGPRKTGWSRPRGGGSGGSSLRSAEGAPRSAGAEPGGASCAAGSPLVWGCHVLWAGPTCAGERGRRRAAARPAGKQLVPGVGKLEAAEPGALAAKATPITVWRGCGHCFTSTYPLEPQLESSSHLGLAEGSSLDESLDQDERLLAIRARLWDTHSLQPRTLSRLGWKCEGDS